LKGEPIRPQPKPTTPARSTREDCCAVVFARARGRCERCGIPVSYALPPWHRRRAQVNERVPRSRGGDPRDPDACELLCRDCHLPDGRHMPTLARLRAHLDRKDVIT